MSQGGVCSETGKKTQENEEGTVGKNRCLPPRGEKTGFVITSHECWYDSVQSGLYSAELMLMVQCRCPPMSELFL